jgi:uncharacterized protein involved in response to NO
MAQRRAHDGPALLLNGFRPFFFGGALWAAVATPVWAVALTAGGAGTLALPAFDWHRHEMIFGWLSAVIAGFLLTAVPNWTGRLPVVGRPLALLAGLWLAGRLLLTLGTPALALPAALVAAAFPAVFAAFAWREVLAGGNRKNFPVAGLVTLYAVADGVFLLGAVGLADSTALGARLGISAVALLIALIGGRVAPSFTRNWLVKQGPGELPAEFDRVDKAGMAVVGLAVVLWLIVPDIRLTGLALAVAGAATLFRLSRWGGLRTFKEPLVTVLHAGYGFLGLGFFGMAADVFVPGVIAGLHGLTVGAIGLMTLAIMTRATLGHTGRDLHADGKTVAIYALIALAALLRLPAPSAGGAYMGLIHASATAWSLGFALYLAVYGPMLLKRR